MTVENVLQYSVKGALAYTGTAGGAASTATGQVDEQDAVLIEAESADHRPIRIVGERLPTRHMQFLRSLMFTVPYRQMDIDLWALNLGLTKSGQVLTIGDSNDSVLCPQISAQISGQDINGDSIVGLMPYASVTPTAAFPFQAGQDIVGNLIFNAEAGVTGNDSHKPTITFGDISATMSDAPGALTTTRRVTLVKGFNNAADDLKDIVGDTDWPIGTIIRIAPFTASYAIDVVETGGITLMTATADPTIVILGGQSILGWMDLQKTGDTPDTWQEIARKDPV